MLRLFGTALRRAIKTLIVLIIVVTIVPAAMVGLALGIVLFTPVPITIPERKTKPEVLPTAVYDSRGALITMFRTVDSNIAISDSDIPEVLKHAVVASEDRRFYTHNGVDAIGLVRALRADAKEGEAQQGASTITQQLVKAVYYPETAVRPDRTEFQRNVDIGWKKLRIAMIANRLDRQMTKNQIVVEYLQNIFFGNGAYGVGAASEAYFRKSVKDLTISEAATLVGIIPAPSKYEPRGNTSNAEFKRKATLRQMLRERFITQQEFDTAMEQRLWVDPGDGTNPPAGQPVTVVFGPTTVTTQYPYFVDYVRRYLVGKYGEAMVYGGGLRVETTLDPTMQDEAEATTAGVLKGTATNLEMSIVSVEPRTGFVRALVGGRDFAADQVNLGLGNCPDEARISRTLKGGKPKLAPACTAASGIDGGGSGRSPGSSIKPIVLAAAFAENLAPSLVIDGSPYRDPRCAKRQRNCTTIRNFEGASYGPVDLRTATIKSVNTSYARLGYELVGIENVAKMAQKLGIVSAWYDPRAHGPSYSLGGLDVSPLEMAAAYSIFAGRGKGAPATPVLTVTDANGKVLEDNLNRRPKQIISQTVADNVTNVLQAVVSDGTGQRAKLADRPVAGKTGTSQDYGNAWFVGYTPTLSTSVWLGYKDRPRRLRNIKGVGNVAGGTIPAATWARYMRKALEGIPPSQFDEPAPIVRPIRRTAVEEKNYQARRGIDLGPRSDVRTTPVSRFIERAAIPYAVLPALDADPLPSTTLPAAPVGVSTEVTAVGATDTAVGPAPTLPP